MLHPLFALTVSLLICLAYSMLNKLIQIEIRNPLDLFSEKRKKSIKKKKIHLDPDLGLRGAGSWQMIGNQHHCQQYTSFPFVL